ncbi:MAG TPA: FAD-dependent oxidoreductase [Motiliproteus sp.]
MSTEPSKVRSQPQASAMKPQLVIIGNGIAGVRLLEEVLAACPDRYRITVIGNEPFGAYNRIMLSPLLAGEAAMEQILIHDCDWYAQQGVQLLAGVHYQAEQIDRVRHQVVCANGQRVPYDRLVLATGSQPAILPIPGAHAKGVMGFRGVRDVEIMQQAAQEGGRAVVIGGGLLGLEAAHGLNRLGMQVTVVHRSKHLLNRQLDEEAAGLLQQNMEARGIAFRLGVNSRAVQTTNGLAQGLELESGEQVSASLIVMAAGIQPQIELAQVSGLRCGRGVLVNDCMQTFDPKIYAVGECVEHRNLTFGLVEPLFEQARVCANHLAAHGVASYRYQESATRLKVSGIQLFSSGDFSGNRSDTQAICYRDPGAGIYKKLVLSDNRLVGAVLYGDTEDGPWYHQLIGDQTDIAAWRGLLMFGREASMASLQEAV